MNHSSIYLRHLTLALPHKICFSDVTMHIYAGNRIGIMGSNGTGKTTLLRLIQNLDRPSNGSVHVPDDVCFGYVTQVIESFQDCSGGQRFQKALTQALASYPNVLLLDEPTNHLDTRNRTSLMRMLDAFNGTLIVVSHDVDLLKRMDTLWIIDQGQLQVFSGSYDAYMHETQMKRTALEQELSRLKHYKKTHAALMHEQERAKKGRLRGEKSLNHNKWPAMIANVKSSDAGAVSGNKRKALRDQRENLLERLSEVRLPEIIVPTFTLQASAIGDRMLVSIQEGSVGYAHHKVLDNIHVSLHSRDRIAISGHNGSGKSTLVKALIGDNSILKEGQWQVCSSKGYLDQHYSTLNPYKTVLETIAHVAPLWSHDETRQHLNSFLFRKNEEVNAQVSVLSGGEKARLSLALIAANTPSLLILDEVTNNVDLLTRQHIIDVLQHFPGAVIIISHDQDFLRQIDVSTQWHVKDGTVKVI